MSKKKVSKVKSKTSNVKQRNRLRNKGKLKTKKHSKVSLLAQLQNKKTAPVPVPEDDHITDDVVDMMDQEDIEYLRNSISQQKYGLLKQIRLKDQPKNQRKQNEFDSLEDEYEASRSIYQNEYNTKMLLPVKTRDGIERRFEEITDTPTNEGEPEDEPRKMEVESSEPNENDDEVSWLDKITDTKEIDMKEPVSMAKIYAKREETVQKYKFRIGLLSSSLLENPEVKIGNLSSLLDIMNEKEPELQITVKKLVTISLMEIFKDLIPVYQIKHQDLPLKKLKKVTQQLVGYESQLLKGYQGFLKKLERMADCLKKKKGNNRLVSSQEKGLGVLAVKCLCELLLAHPYFNYAENIVHLLTLYLDNPDEGVRKIVEDCYKKIFHDDKRGLLSLIIVRRINHLVKTRAHSVHCEALAVLLALRIRDVNLDQEKEDEIKNKKFMSRRQKVLTMSKKERKRKKELEKLDREMLEVNAEENKKSKEQHMTEIVKLVFLIYFRILKRAPRSNLLSITLEGLAKFTHCINLEYYQDLVNVLDKLLEKEPLKVREQLYCIKTVFIILSGQEDILSIDPLYFYTHLYKIMLSVHAGKTHENTDLLLSTLEAVLINKTNKMTTQRLLSFTKRLGTLALQLLHNGSLGCLCILKSVLQVTKAADLLLDVDSNYGQGVYNPELSEPEYCNAGNTALWELCALHRHYHPIVKKMSTHISNGAPTMGEGSLPPNLAKMNCTKWYEEYDSSSVAFNPAVPPPKKTNNRSFKTPNLNTDFINCCTEALGKISEDVNFSRLFK